MSSATNEKFNPVVWAYHTKQHDLKLIKEAATTERNRLLGEVSRLQRDIADLNNIIGDEIYFANPRLGRDDA